MSINNCADVLVKVVEMPGYYCANVLWSMMQIPDTFT